MSRFSSRPLPDPSAAPAWVLVDGPFERGPLLAHLATTLRPDQVEVALSLASNFVGDVGELAEAAAALQP